MGYFPSKGVEDLGLHFIKLNKAEHFLIDYALKENLEYKISYNYPLYTIKIGKLSYSSISLCYTILNIAEIIMENPKCPIGKSV